MRIVWSDDALDDVERIHLYIRERNPIAARQVAERLFAAAASLSDFPHRGPGSTAGFRELVIVRPYVLVYRVQPEGVRIVRVWRGAPRRDG